MTHIADLQPDMIAYVAAHREWVEGWITPDSQTDYTDWGNMLSLAAAIVGSKEVKPDETVKLQALGTYLGLVMSSATGWPIKQVTDEYGTDVAVVFREPDGIIFPSTLVSKRIEADEDVDVYELVGGLISQAQEILAHWNKCPNLYACRTSMVAA